MKKLTLQLCLCLAALVCGASQALAIQTQTSPAAVPQFRSGPGDPIQYDTSPAYHRPGSLLIWPYYVSSTANPLVDTRINLINFDDQRAAFVHLFFVDGVTCSVADRFICLTQAQRVSFNVRDEDPGVRGFLIAVAVNGVNGCPTQSLIYGDAFVRNGDQVGAYQATHFAQLRPIQCDPNQSQVTLNLDGLDYSKAFGTVIIPTLVNPLQGTTTTVLVRVGGDLHSTIGPIGTLFGVLYNDREDAVSYTLNGGCQYIFNFGQPDPRTVPRFNVFIPPGTTGWSRLWSVSNPQRGLAGIFLITAAGNENVRTGYSIPAGSLVNSSFVMPLFPPSC
jgi:hypothetical protein